MTHNIIIKLVPFRQNQLARRSPVEMINHRKVAIRMIGELRFFIQLAVTVSRKLIPKHLYQLVVGIVGKSVTESFIPCTTEKLIDLRNLAIAVAV